MFDAFMPVFCVLTMEILECVIPCVTNEGVRVRSAAHEGIMSFGCCSFCRLQPAKRTPPKTSRTKISNTQRTENKTTDVVIHQHGRKLLKMDILMSETC